jgi:rhodanese-related sulfurtransferase
MRAHLPAFVFTKKFILGIGALTLLLYLCLLLLINNGVISTPTQTTAKTAKAVLTTYKEPLAKIQDGHQGSTWQLDKVGIVDVRGEDAYREHHIVGSMNIPLVELSGVTFSSGRTIIIYTNNATDGQKARDIIAKQSGITVILLGGDIEQLKQLGYKIT